MFLNVSRTAAHFFRVSPESRGGGIVNQEAPAAVIIDGFGRCYPSGATSNIAVDFLYRGLYLTQLQRLDAAFGPSNVMVFLDSDLRSHPQAVLDAITTRIGLPRLQLSSNATEEAAAKFSALYPEFSKMTGWSLQGRYASLPVETERLLRAFYEPYNQALYRYLGVDLGWS